MRVLLDINKNKSKIISSIKKFGFSPEHNYYHFLYKQTPHKKCVFFDFGQKMGLMAAFSKSNSTWHVIGEVLAPYKEGINIFLKFLSYTLVKKKSKKVICEFENGFKSKVFKELKNSKFKISMNYALYWPIYAIKNLDEKLSGKQWKKLRNISNRFNKHFIVHVKNPKKIGKNELKNIVFSWLKRRNPRDKVDSSYYLNIIDNSFKGFEVVRALSINGEPCSISGGWRIPNSNDFYYAIGIFNYKHKDMGDFVNLIDLMYLKKIGYKHVDLGGSDNAILYSKKKFKPERVYKTYIFSISRRE